MEDYKIDVINTRKGCVGSSDAKMLAEIDRDGCVSNSMLKRLAVLKGFIEHEEISSPAMKYGDFIEQKIYECLSDGDDKKYYSSNPCIVSDKYSRNNVKVIDHVDFFYKNDDKKLICMYECKASKYNTTIVRQLYKAQLYHHYLIGKELAEKLKYKLKIYLVHYDTSGVDLEKPFEFDPSRMTVVNIKFKAQVFNMKKSIDILSAYLDTFTCYNAGDVIPFEYLPTRIQEQFNLIANVIREIKEKEAQVDEFKKKLYAFFEEKGIKNIKNDMFTITLFSPTESKSFDSKKYLSDLEEKHPRVYKKIVKDYTKTTKKNGYVQIKLK